ncbi:Na+(H+)/acetate symporter ActP [Chryseobacterium shigense]|uniref:Na+(H+)/acetate symporter ActP n=1 Tax=Chryseobacterium shigense TaxID=297244 RepID=A0A841NE12_9FLAO|nr:Na+(H+)/acetate symporter ActP [Chryseobacterium shigense]
MELLFFVFILLIPAGISYLVVRFFNRWTAKSQHKTVLNGLIFIASYALLLFISFVIFMSNVNMGR